VKPAPFEYHAPETIAGAVELLARIGDDAKVLAGGQSLMQLMKFRRVKPRVLEVTRPASGERARLLYWKDGEVIESAYQELCHLLRDVNGGGKTAPMDPNLLETLWGTQAFVARYGMTAPLEILSGYRTPESNQRLREQGVPAARKSLHMDGKAADIRVPQLDASVLGGLVRSFRQGGVGFYYRSDARGGWIHADTGLQRTWKG